MSLELKRFALDTKVWTMNELWTLVKASSTELLRKTRGIGILVDFQLREALIAVSA